MSSVGPNSVINTLSDPVTSKGSGHRRFIGAYDLREVNSAQWKSGLSANSPLKIVCWNIAKRRESWNELLEMSADVALLQEAGEPPKFVDVPDELRKPSFTAAYDRWPLVVSLSDRTTVEHFSPVTITDKPGDGEIAVSDPTTIAAARIIPQDGEPFIAVSMYARWLKPHPSTNSKWKVGHSDASAHRIISDLSAFIGSLDSSTHRILAAGDLNMIYGATKDNKLALPARDQTVFDRIDALGLEFIGPQYPNGRKANPPPQGLPPNTKNVPTYHTTRRTPEAAQNQLDYVFASRGFHNEVSVRAMNTPAEWGSSDHCRLCIEVRTPTGG